MINAIIRASLQNRALVLLLAALLTAAGAYSFVAADVPTVAAPQYLAVRAGMPDDTVYEVLKAVYEHSDILFAAHAESRLRFSPDGIAAGLAAAERSGDEFHPGALRFYREMGWVE